MENEARIFQLQRLSEEGQPIEEELEKAVETAIRGVEDQEELETYIRRPISRWRQQVIPEAPWEKDWREGEEVIFERRRHSRRVTRNGRTR